VTDSSDLFTYNAKYFHTLSGKKWRSFVNSLRSMLKCRSTVHEVTWQFNNLAYSCGLIVCLARSFLELLLGHYSV